MDAAVAQARRELPEPGCFDVNQLAAYTGLPRKTWEHLRSRGGGPPYVKLGRHVRYIKTDVDEWLAQRRQRNTADEVGR